MVVVSSENCCNNAGAVCRCKIIGIIAWEQLQGNNRAKYIHGDFGIYSPGLGVKRYRAVDRRQKGSHQRTVQKCPLLFVKNRWVHSICSTSKPLVCVSHFTVTWCICWYFSLSSIVYVSCVSHGHNASSCLEFDKLYDFFSFYFSIWMQSFLFQYPYFIRHLSSFLKSCSS